MNKLLALTTILFLSATPTEQPKQYTLTFTPQETQIIFDALGDLPAKKVEAIRYKIASEVEKQNGVKK